MKNNIFITVAVMLTTEVSASNIRSEFKADTSGTCYSAITAAPVNPFSNGIAGNWRPKTTYIYYGNRVEQDATQNINIRTAGNIADFVPFWKQENNNWKATDDSIRWVWNQQSTLINAKGFELENKDPLGRYNAGIYGYDDELPVAVIQNSRYREVVSEGFEDYDYGVRAYLTSCPVGRSFDFTGRKSWLDSTVSHTGKFSLLLPPGENFSIGALVSAEEITDFNFSINTKGVACRADIVGLDAIRMDKKVIIPSFTPFPGRKMLLSAWVKEQADCKCDNYAHAEIMVRAGSNTVSCKPSGNIIDGWQRIEQVIDVPADATQFSVEFIAVGTGVYFDDLRIHPYSANMKSYAYDPVTLRLMAELDENNFASFYEYDDEGTLVRVKKETERGIKTIKESRSALIKDGIF